MTEETTDESSDDFPVWEGPPQADLSTSNDLFSAKQNVRSKSQQNVRSNPTGEVGGMSLPHSREAEEAVVGAMLINPDVYYDDPTYNGIGVGSILAPDDFYIHRLRFVWQAYVRLIDRGVPIDILTVSEELDDMGNLEEIGGQAYLTSLLNQVPTTLHAEAYARIVEAASLRRKILVKANAMATLAYDASKPMVDVEKELDKLNQDHVTVTRITFVTAPDAADELWEEIDQGIPSGVETGLPNEDDVLGGYPKAGVTMVIGDSSIGKTAKALQSAETVDFKGGRSLYITLESKTTRMVARRVFSQLGIPQKKMRNASLTVQEKQALRIAIDQYKIAHPRLAFDDKARTLEAIAKSVRQHKPDFVVIDDLMHVQHNRQGRGSSSDTSILLEVAMRLKDIAIDGNCAMYVIHTLGADEAKKFWPGSASKPTSNMPPAIDSIAWAKDLRFRVDIFLAIVPDFKAKFTDDTMKLIEWVMKDREGPRLDAIEIYYDKIAQWFYDNSTLAQQSAHTPLPASAFVSHPGSKAAGKTTAKSKVVPKVTNTGLVGVPVAAMAGLPKPRDLPGFGPDDEPDLPGESAFIDEPEFPDDWNTEP